MALLIEAVARHKSQVIERHDQHLGGHELDCKLSDIRASTEVVDGSVCPSRDVAVELAHRVLEMQTAKTLLYLVQVAGMKSREVGRIDGMCCRCPSVWQQVLQDHQQLGPFQFQEVVRRFLDAPKGIGGVFWFPHRRHVRASNLERKVDDLKAENIAEFQALSARGQLRDSDVVDALMDRR